MRYNHRYVKTKYRWRRGIRCEPLQQILQRRQKHDTWTDNLAAMTYWNEIVQVRDFAFYLIYIASYSESIQISAVIIGDRLAPHVRPALQHEDYFVLRSTVCSSMLAPDYECGTQSKLWNPSSHEQHMIGPGGIQHLEKEQKSFSIEDLERCTELNLMSWVKHPAEYITFSRCASRLNCCSECNYSQRHSVDGRRKLHLFSVIYCARRGLFGVQ